MADERLMKYGRWLIDNADKKGTPEFETVAQAYKKLRGMAAPNAPQISVGEDVARSVTQRGVPRGIAGVLGAPGDIYNLMQSGVGAAYEYGREKLLGPRSQEDQAARDADMANLQTGLTQEGMLNAYKGMGGKLYEPQTTAGKYAATGTEFGVGGLVGGPRAAVQSAIAGLASEGAGQLTEGTAAEPYARAGAAILTGGGLAARDARRQAKKVPSLMEQRDQLKSADEWKQAARTGFKSVRNTGMQVKSQKASQFLQDLGTDLANDGLRKKNYPKATSALEELDTYLSKGNLDIDDLRAAREVASSAVSRDALGNLTPEGQFAARIQGAIDDFIENLQPSDMVGGADPVQMAKTLSTAKKQWGIAKRSEIVENMISNAEITAGANYTQSGMENALRKEFAKLARNKRKMKSFSKEEQKLIRNVAIGGKLENGLRGLGKYAPTSTVALATGSGMAGWLASQIDPSLAVPAAIATGGAGIAARNAATRMTGNNALNAEYFIRSGGQLPQSRWPVIGQSLGRSALGTSGGLMASRPGGSR